MKFWKTTALKSSKKIVETLYSLKMDRKSGRGGILDRSLVKPKTEVSHYLKK